MSTTSLIDSDTDIGGPAAIDTQDSLRHQAIGGSHIDFYQDIPPVPADRNAIVAATLLELHDGKAMPNRLRYHRYAGTEVDRQAAADWVGVRFGRTPEADRVVIAHGTQSAMSMILGYLIGRDGVVLTEALTYPSVKPLARLLGIEVRGIAMDDGGLSPDELDRFCRGDQRPKALYCMPTVHNPTTVTMSQERRQAIADVARRHDVLIVEDDAYGLFQNDAPPPLATIVPENTWYVTSLAKSLALQLRVTIVVAPSAAATLRAFGPTQRMTHWMAAPLPAELATLLIRGGCAHRLLEGVRAEAGMRQRLALATLAGLDVQTCSNSLHLWLRLPNAVDRNRFVSSACSAGVLVGVSDAFSVPPCPAPNAVRICLGAPPDRNQIVDGLDILRRLLAST